MAWYPARGGGIPASVKTDMNAVLNKKFGTVGETYPPREWADDVNLMGLLPIRTASGAVASFSDGADDVPCVSVMANIVPYQEGTGDPSQSNKRPIHGHTECEVTQQGANIFDFSNLQTGYRVVWGTGADYADASASKSDYILVKEGARIRFSDSVYVLGYDAEKTYLGAFISTLQTWEKQSGSMVDDMTIPKGTAYIKIMDFGSISGTITSAFVVNYGATQSTDKTYRTARTYTTEMPVMKNLFTGAWEDKTVNESRPSGTTYANMKSASTTRKTTAELLRLPSAPFVFSCSSGYDLFLTFYDEGGLYIGQYKSWSDSKVITSTDAKYVGVTFRKSNTQTLTADDEEAVHVQLEEGSTATSYEPYRTVFVGTLDLVSGLLTITHRFQALDALNWAKNGSTITFYSETLTGLQGETDDFYCSCYLPTINGGYNGQNGKTSIKTSGDTSRIWVADNSYSTSADFKNSLTGQTAVLKLSTPIEVQLTPEEVRTFLGANNFWADTGDTEVEYRADIDLLLASLQGNRGLQMTRSASQLENTENEEEQEATDETNR